MHHGSDPAPPGVDVLRRATLTELRERANAAPTKSEAGAMLPCSGKAPFSVQTIYAHLQGTPDNLATYRALLERYAQDIEWSFHTSAAETGGERAVRFVTGEGCTLDVASVSVSATASQNMAKMQTELKADGFNAHDRKYLVWMDGTDAYCGIGAYYPDPRPGVGAHCTATLSYAYSGRVKAGRVTTQKPKAGTKLPNAGRVTIVVSKGPKPKRG